MEGGYKGKQQKELFQSLGELGWGGFLLLPQHSTIPIVLLVLLRAHQQRGADGCGVGAVDGVLSSAQDVAGDLFAV